MTKNIGIARRSIALALAGTMVCGCAMGAAAQGPAVKRDETVFATLASDGTVQSATDSVWLHADGGLNGYTEDTGLSEVTMLKDTEQPAQDGSRLSFSTSDTDAYYQGTASSDLPVTAHITYTLDGTEMTAEELAGQSGHLVMHVALTNNSYQMKTVGGQSRRICTPFVTVVAVTLDTDTFAAVQAENGTVQTDSSKDLVAYVCLPGMQECFDGLLNGDLSELGDKLTDEVTLEADVTDFEMPMMYIAASTDASDFSKEDELSDFDDLFDELDGIDGKLDDMMDGVDKLLDGSNDLNKGANDLYNGVQTLDNGAATLSNGLNTLSGNSGTINGGVAQVKTGVMDSANQQLAAYGVTLTWDNYAATLQGLINNKCAGVPFSAEDYTTAYNGVKATLKAVPYSLDESDAENVYRYACGLVQNISGETYAKALQDAGAACAPIKTALEEYTAHSTKPWEISSVEQVCIGAVMQAGNLTPEQAAGVWNGYDDTDKQDVYSGILAQVSGQYMVVVLGSDLYVANSAAYNNNVSVAFAKAGEKLTTFNNYTGAEPAKNDTNALLTQVLQNTMTGTLGSLKGSLDGILALESGIAQYTAGVDSAAAGAGTLKTGADQLLSGAATLKTGTGTLVDGVQELYDGVDEAYDKIQNNTSDISLDDLQDIKDTLEEVKAQRENYTSFAGGSEEADGSVKFVMKVSAEKADDTEATANTTQAAAKNGNFFTDLWKRIVALFHN